MTVVSRHHMPSEDTSPSRAERLAAFAAVVARSSLGTPEALDDQQLGREVRKRYEPPNADGLAIGADLMLAVGQHLQGLALDGAAELAYLTAVERGSADAAVALADLLARGAGSDPEAKTVHVHPVYL